MRLRPECKNGEQPRTAYKEKQRQTNRTPDQTNRTPDLNLKIPRDHKLL